MGLRVLKRIAVIILVLAIAGAVVGGCGGGLSKSDVAVIGNVTITQDELNKRLPDFEAQYFSGDVPDKSSSDYKDFERVVLDYLVTLEIATQKAPSLKVLVTDKDVQDQIDQVKKSYFNGDESQLEAALKQQNVTLVQYKASLREQVLLQKTYDAVTKNVPNPTDAELQAYYTAHKTDYLPG